MTSSSPNDAQASSAIPLSRGDALDSNPDSAGDPVLHMIDLDQELVGHRKFLSCWVHRSDELTFLSDPGPRSTIEKVIAELHRLGIGRLDYVLLSHVHLDHAGGTAELAEAFPSARVVCHPRGAEHMIDPERLWESSRQVLGHVAEAYGAPTPVPASRFIDPAKVSEVGIRVLETPGHAAHHYSFLCAETLFVGEAAGLRIPLAAAPWLDQPSGADPVVYLRPATPTRFRLEPALGSIDRLLALEPAPRRMAYPHVGIVDDPGFYLRTNREQLTRWVDLLRTLVRQGVKDPVPLAHRHLMRSDAYYGNFPHLEPDIQERERMYVRQTMEGMLEYIRSRSVS